MANKPITMCHGHACLTSTLGELLRECRGKGATRYYLTEVEVRAESFAVTDGKRLVAIKLAHELEAGLYHLTSDNFLLRNPDGEKVFPKWDDIILSPDKRTELWAGRTDESFSATQTASVIISELGKAKRIFDFEFFFPVVQLMCKLLDKITVYAATEDTGPCMIVGTGQDMSVTYLQMPLSTS